MPLIDSIIKTIVRERQPEYLIVQEPGGGDRYRFTLEQAFLYIENEILEIRVTGLNRSVEIGKPTELLGVVVGSELNPQLAGIPPLEVKPDGEWDPVKTYGPDVARQFFPQHCDKPYPKLLLQLEVSKEFLEEYENMLREQQTASTNPDSTKTEAMITRFSRILEMHPNHLTPYIRMGTLFADHKMYPIAMKYFELLRRIAEMSLPPDSDDFVLTNESQDNMNYLDALAMNATFLMAMDQKEEAIALFKRYFKHAPMDYHGVRFRLKELTGEEYPFTDPKNPVNLEPYEQLDTITVPLNDVYYPDTRPDPQKWLRFHPNYKALMIVASHPPIDKSVSYQEISRHIEAHILAEDAIADDSPQGTRLLVARYIASGVSRHEAIHMIGMKLLEAIRKMNSEIEGEDESSHEHVHGPDCGCDHDHGAHAEHR